MRCLLTSKAVLFAMILALVHGARIESHYSENNSRLGNSSESSFAAVPTRQVVASYFENSSHPNLLFAHILVSILAWVFVLPISVMLSVVRSRFAIIVQVIFLVLNAIGVLLASFSKTSPDLYENDAHLKLGWALSLATASQFLVGILCKHLTPTDPVAWSDELAHETLESRSSLISEYEPLSLSEAMRPANGSSPWENLKIGNEDRKKCLGKVFLPSPSGIKGYLIRHVPSILPRSVYFVFRVYYGIIDRLVLILAFAVIISGLVTYFGIFRNNHVFNGLAHSIKGGIFFWYGILTLSRWLGCFAEFGWAWNIRPDKVYENKHSFPILSMEFWESFLLFLYGSTNVFLERLAANATGKGWSASDLEHVSISVMFLGGGLCGMLVESKIIRNILNSTIRPSSIRSQSLLSEASWSLPISYKSPMNPLPSIMLFLLGMIMSSHHQASIVSTTVHKQWGNLLSGAALARGATYILFFVSPPTSHLPSRPPTELLVAFCLMAGGLIFMASNKDTIAGMENHQLPAMFVFIVTMGFTAFLMAWVTIVVTIKGLTARKVSPIKT